MCIKELIKASCHMSLSTLFVVVRHGTTVSIGDYRCLPPSIITSEIKFYKITDFNFSAYMAKRVLIILEDSNGNS